MDGGERDYDLPGWTKQGGPLGPECLLVCVLEVTISQNCKESPTQIYIYIYIFTEVKLNIAKGVRK